MTKIIFTADDYGCVDEIDKGIRYAIKGKMTNSVAVFANGPNRIKSFAAIKKLQDGKLVDVGCHLTITSGSPLSDVTEFSKGDRFRAYYELKRKGTFSKKKREKIKVLLRTELEAQIK